MITVEKSNILDKETKKIIKLLERMITKRQIPRQRIQMFKKNNIQSIEDNIKDDYKCYFDLILEDVLNYYVAELSKLNVKDYFLTVRDVYFFDERDKLYAPYREIQLTIDDILECYNHPYSEVLVDTEYIASDIIKKSINLNGWDMLNPIKFEYIKYYSIPAYISPKYIYEIIWYVIIYIATHYYILKDSEICTNITPNPESI